MPKLRFPGFEGEWENTELGNLVVYGKDKTRVTKNHYVSTENIEQDFRGIIPFEDAETIVDGTEFTKGDVLIANIRPYLKKVWQSNMYGACNADVLVMKPQEIDNDFLYNLIAQNRFIDYVMGGVKGSKMPRGDKAHILQYNTAVPSIVEQRQIARFLSLLSNRITMQKKLIETLKKYKRGLLRAYFMTNERTAHSLWEKCKLGVLCSKIGSGKTPRGGSSVYVNHGIMFLRSQNVLWGMLDISNVSYINEETNRTMLSSGVHYGDILLNITGASIGRSCIYSLNDRANVNQHVCVIRLSQEGKEKILPNFLLQQILSDHIQQQVSDCQNGGSREGLNFQQIAGFDIVLPEIEEQRKICSMLNAFDKKMLSEECSLKALFDFRTSLMQQLFI